jgi:16S rRNA (uracil1498-N3)-methyltransferase
MKENSHIFYVPDAKDATVGQQVYLDEDESAHCCKVLRLRPGEVISIIDGFGHMYEAELTICDRRNCAASITQIDTDTYIRPYRNHVAIAPTKNIDRFEWFVEKAVEFGIDEITPILCDHSERKVLKTDRLQKIIISAVKQSGNATMPILNELTPFADFVDKCTAPCRMIAHCEPQEKKLFHQNVSQGQSSCILIGPEGDFSNAEISLALQSGFLPTSLGYSRLRTETAGVAVCAFLAEINM